MKHTYFWLWIARHLPAKVVYFCGIILWSEAVRTGGVASEIKMDEVLKRYDESKNIHKRSAKSW